MPVPKIITRVPLRDYRKYVSTLKKKGLIGAQYDARSVHPNKYLSEKIRKYWDVIEGRAAVAKLSRSQAREFKDAGYRTAAQNRVVVPLKYDQKAIVSHGKLTLKSPGRTEIILPVTPFSVEKTLTDLEANRKALNKKYRGKDQNWTFEYFGNRTGMYSRDIAALIEQLRGYVSIRDAINSRRRKENAEVVKAIRFVILDRGYQKTQFTPEMQAAEREKRNREYNPAAYKRRKRRLKQGPIIKQLAFKESKAEADKRYREKKAQDPEWRKKNAARAKKWNKAHRDKSKTKSAKNPKGQNRDKKPEKPNKTAKKSAGSPAPARKKKS